MIHHTDTISSISSAPVAVAAIHGEAKSEYEKTLQDFNERMVQHRKTLQANNKRIGQHLDDLPVKPPD